MPLVKPNYVTWNAAFFLQRVGFLISVLAQLHLIIFLYPYMQLKQFPRIDNNPYLKLTDTIKESVLDKLVFDFFLISMFFLQHSIMARKTFKSFMHTITANQYYYLEIPLYVFLSGILTLIMIYNFKPITNIAWEGFQSQNMFYLQIAMMLFGCFQIFQAKIDQINNDPYGFSYVSHFSQEGNHFPLTFKMKNMSRAAFLCRHPMVSGLIFVLLGTLMHGTITWGRILVTSMLIIGSMIGLRFEEKGLIENVGKQYEKLMEYVPNQVIPDLMVLFYSEDQLDEMRKQIEIVQ